MAEISSSGDAPATVVSAPGKVLLAGGYLVLDPAYPGIVVATSSRFYTVVERAASSNGKGKARQTENADVTVHSPQFVGALWQYHLRVKDGNVSVVQTAASANSSTAGRNPFVGLALLYCHRLARELLGEEEYQRKIADSVEITIVGDNDFYSQRQEPQGEHEQDQGQSSLALAPTSDYLRSLKPFTPLGIPIRDVHKTGLGSSAAMTTSLVGALLIHLGVVPQTLTNHHRALIHNTAQLAHCAAQGKVGSGFDVSAAVWGSQLYRRFDPKVLQPILDDGAQVIVEGQEGDASDFKTGLSLQKLLEPENADWRPSTASTAVEGLAKLSSSSSSVPRPAALHLPPRISLVLADVDTGSNTPSLVSKVLAWRKAKPEWAKQLYSVLDASNQSLADGLLALTLTALKDAEEYNQVLDSAAAVESSKWDEMQKARPNDTLAKLLAVRNALRSIRAGMRELGQRAGAPVEPDEMGKLIAETCKAAPGILGGGVPGAGGYDALYLLYLESSTVDPRRQAETFWSKWEGLSVGPLLSTTGAGSISTSTNERTESLHPDLPDAALRLSGSSGLQIHNVDGIKGLREVI